MTITRAREILGSYGQKLSDEQILTIIGNFNVLISVGFEQLELNIVNTKGKEVLQCQKIEPIIV